MEIIYSHSKIEDFILHLDDATISRVDQMIKRLGNLGHGIRMPHSKSIGDGLFELRIKGAKQIRIFYTFHNNQAVLLNIFLKKTWLIPKKEIEYARNILKQYIA